MKLRWLHIQGFKSIKDISLDIDNFLSLIGQNNHGKSNIFYALDLFFSSGARNITPDLFFRNQTEIAEKIIIEGQFEDLSQVEVEKLSPWIVDGKFTLTKKYWIDNGGKSQFSFELLRRVPANDWLRDDFVNYNNRDVISSLTIRGFLPETGRISKQIYKEAIDRYIQANHDEIEWIIERIENPSGYKQVIERYLPEYYLVPAVRDVIEETKTTGTALLSRILGILITRIAGQNPAFLRLQGIIREIKTQIEGNTEEEKLAEIRDLESKLESELSHWNVGLSIGVDAPNIERIFQLGTNVKLNDGIETSIDEKGHGLQRSLIFALMRVWATETRRMQEGDLEEIYERSFIFAFEEPELYLHPQMCRATFESLKQISITDQVLICTHSPHFIDMEDYNHIAIVRKKDLLIGTQVMTVDAELFEGERKKQFNMVQFFNPDRNELFFARKVILVEGATEKAVLPLLGRHIGCFDHKVSLIDCGSKFNLTLYIEILNAFHIPYLVIYDEDPIDPELEEGGLRYNPDRLREARRALAENQRINETVDLAIGTIQQIRGNFEKLLGISRAQADRLSKPLAAVEKYTNEDDNIPQDVEDLVRLVYR